MNIPIYCSNWIVLFFSLLDTKCHGNSSKIRAVGSNLKVRRPDNVISNLVAAGGFV